MVVLLSAFAVAAAVSAIASLIALRVFSWFRSGERKPGDFKPDQSTGSGTHHVEIRTGGRRPRVVRARSSELPLIGGVAMILAILAGCVTAGFLVNFSGSQWTLIEILMLATIGYGVVGLTDDIRKVYRGVGISEIQKAIGVVLVSALSAVLLNRLIIAKDITARLAYPPYNQAPIIGALLVKQHFAWVFFFLAMTIIIASVTALAVDFTDGMDGLAGGLMFSAALAYAVILIDEGSAAALAADRAGAGAGRSGGGLLALQLALVVERWREPERQAAGKAYHGRYWLAGAGRAARAGRHRRPAGVATADHRRRIRAGGSLGADFGAHSG